MYGKTLLMVINFNIKIRYYYYTYYYYFYYYLLTKSDNHKISIYNQINHAQLNFVIKMVKTYVC